MSGFDALMYAAGLLMFWLGLIVLTISLFVAASRGDDVRECEACGDTRGPGNCVRGCGPFDWEEDESSC